MKQKKYLKILVGAGAAIILILLLLPVIIRPWIRNKLELTFNTEKSNYLVTVDKVKSFMIPAGIELKGIRIKSKKENSSNKNLEGEIKSLKIKGISLTKAFFSKEAKIRKIIISESYFAGKYFLPGDTAIRISLPFKLSIGIVLFDEINMAVENGANASAFSVNDGILGLHDVNFEKYDTLSFDAVKKFDFEAKELVSISADSMYLYRSKGIIYSNKANTLIIDSVSIHPNYTDYDFTSRFKYQTNRIEAGLSNINIYNFDIAGYVRSGDLKSSFVEVGNMDMEVFRDNRKEFRHVNKPEFQDIIYNYRGNIRIDSAALLKGNITYTEHTFEANESGYLSFSDINTRIYNITNDTIHKTDTTFLMLKVNALFMGKSKIAVLLKARIFDSNNTFSINGTLSATEANEMNPFLEKKAFIYITSGRIDIMNFSFLANSQKAQGTMILKYQGLDLAVKNKDTDDTTALRERFISWVVNRKVLNSNPLPDEEVREGIIDFERDPERYVVHYCGKSILSGIRSSIQRDSKK